MWHLFFVFLLSHCVSAAVLRVPQDQDSIQTALDLAMNGDTVLVAPGIWTQPARIGPGRVTLCSNYLFSQDSMDIVNTVLDGQHQGTILTVDMDAASWLEINGLTITHGEGDFDFDSATFTGGGINILHAGETHLSNLVFHDNHAPRDGAALYYTDTSYWPSSRVYLENINCYSNEGDQAQINLWKSLKIYGPKIIDASRLRINSESTTWSMQYYLWAVDSLVLSDCVFRGLNHLNGPPMNFMVGNIYNLDGYSLKVSDFYVTDCNFPRGGGFALGSGDGINVILHNVHLERNHFPQGDMQFRLMGNGRFEADSIFICNNESQKSYSFFENGMPGIFRNLFVIGNHMGSNAHFTPTDGPNPTMMNVSFDGALFQDNINERSLADPGDYDDGGSLIYINCFRPDTIIYKNMRFINNLHIDHDVYNMEDLCEGNVYPNYGRLISGFHGVAPAYFLMDSCQFIRNRESNMVPEVECPGLFGSQMLVGNNVQLWAIGDPAEVNIDLRNIIFGDCDDGAIWIGNRNRILMENIEIINCKRQGLIVDNNSIQDSVILRNILISGIQQQQSFSFSPYRSCYQSAFCFSLNNNNNVEISNMSIIGCDVPFLIKQWGSPLNRTIKNSIFANNSVTHAFVHPLSGPLSFTYCLLPGESPGEGNLWGVDPGFDPVLGPPWLAADSPCVDAGTPDPACQDREDPANPGLPLWPSLGGLRNDMGYTGGPHASLAPDTTWAALPDWQPTALPQAFALGAPWPNPFNPVVQVPLELTKPSLVRLEVFNVLGQQVAVLHDGLLPAGRRSFRWDAQGQASGLYFVTLTVDLDKTATRAITLLH